MSKKKLIDEEYLSRTLVMPLIAAFIALFLLMEYKNINTMNILALKWIYSVVSVITFALVFIPIYKKAKIYTSHSGFNFNNHLYKRTMLALLICFLSASNISLGVMSVNTLFDGSPGRVVRGEVMQKEVDPNLLQKMIGRQTRVSFRVDASGDALHGKGVGIYVPTQDYNRLVDGAHVGLVVHDGAFGLPYVAEVLIQ